MAVSKQKWTEGEEVALKEGVDKYGPGKWRAIQKDASLGLILSLRSNVDLKDKWRNMTVALGQVPLSPFRAPSKSKRGSKARATMRAAAAKALESQSAMPTSMVAIDRRMVLEALLALGDSRAWSSEAILTQIQKKGHVASPSLKRRIASSLKRLCEDGTLLSAQQTDGATLYSFAPEAAEPSEKDVSKAGTGTSPLRLPGPESPPPTKAKGALLLAKGGAATKHEAEGQTGKHRTRGRTGGKGEKEVKSAAKGTSSQQKAKRGKVGLDAAEERKKATVGVKRKRRAPVGLSIKLKSLRRKTPSELARMAEAAFEEANALAAKAEKAAKEAAEAEAVAAAAEKAVIAAVVAKGLNPQQFLQSLKKSVSCSLAGNHSKKEQSPLRLLL